MTQNLEKTATPWKGIADMWNTYFTPPSRISGDEVKKYREWLKRLKRPEMKALVLGVTPEIRELLFALGYKITCIDINPEMIKAMDSVIKTKDPNEIIINENWLGNSIPSHSFDIVVGDCVLENVLWEQRDELLFEIVRILKPNKLFITRIFTVPRKKPYNNIHEVLEKFSEKEPNYRSALEFIFDLQILFYTERDHKGTFSKPKEEIEKLRVNGRFSFKSEKLNKLLDLVWNFWCQKYVNKVYYYPYQDEEEIRVQNFFKIEEKFNQAQDNEYSKYTPMYILKLKS
ncbi:MAG: class I SAM-dependent methyltransferase [archaeon]